MSFARVDNRDAFCRNRNAFSLMELIIVLAILIAVAAMAVPMMQRSFEGQKLDKAADLVRAGMGRARVKAIRSGDVVGFFYQVDGAAFTVVPFNAEQLKRLETMPIDANQRSSNFDFSKERLPRDVRFSTAKAMESSRAIMTLADLAYQPGQMRPILFYPDGTSQDAKIILQNRQGDAIQVNLRGLTGTTTVTRIIDDRQLRL